jgi:hypothetical protein
MQCYELDESMLQDLPEQLVFNLLVKIFPAFMAPKTSSPYSEKTWYWINSEPSQSNQNPHIPFI